MFVVRIQNGAVEWIDVKRGASMGNQVEVFGNLNTADLVTLRGTDELRAGTQVQIEASSANQKRNACKLSRRELDEIQEHGAEPLGLLEGSEVRALIEDFEP